MPPQKSLDEQRLERLNKDHVFYSKQLDEIADTLRVEINPATRIQLKEQIRQLEIEIEELEQEIAAQETKIATKQIGASTTPHVEAQYVAPLTAQQWFDKGLAAIDYHEKIICFSEAITLNSNFVDAYQHRGNAYYYRGEYDQAIADYTEAIHLKPNYAIYYRRGIIYQNQKNYDHAIADFEATLRIYPNFRAAQTDLEQVRRLQEK